MINLKSTILIFVFLASFGYSQTNKNFELRKQANIAYHEGHIYRALELLNLALFNDSTDALAFFNLANIYLSVPHRERAIKNFNRSIKLDPSKIDLILNQFIVFSGLSLKLDNLAHSFTSNDAKKDSLIDSTFSRLVLKYMSRDSLEKSLKDYLKNNSNIPMFVDYFLWLNSPLARKLVKKESTVSNSNVSKYKISNKRKKLLYMLDDVTKTTKSTYSSIEKLTDVLKSYSSTDSIEATSKQSKIDSSLLRALKNITINKFMVSYSHLSDNEIIELIDFYNSDLGQWLVRMKNDGYEHVLYEASAKIFKEYKKIKMAHNKTLNRNLPRGR